MLLPSLLLPLLAGCPIIIEIDDSSTTSGGSDTDTADSSDTEELADSGSSGCQDEDPCTTSGDSTDGTDDTAGTTDSVPPPGPSYCDMTPVAAVGGMAEDSQTLPQIGELTDIHVLVRLTHHQIGDLTLVVEHANTPVTLVSQPMSGSCQGSHVDAIFDDDAEIPADESCETDGSAIVGAVIPTDALEVLHGVEGGGDWILRATEEVDPNEPSVLTIEGWCLAVSTGEPLELE